MHSTDRDTEEIATRVLRKTVAFGCDSRMGEHWDMTASPVKERLIQRHLDNAWLQAAILMPMGKNVDDLSVEQPTTAVDSSMVESAVLALQQGQTHYVDVQGIPPLRDKLALFVQSLGGHDYTSGHLLVTAGVQEARFLALQVVGEALGGVAIPAVVHPGVRLALGVRPLSVSELPVTDEAGYLPTLEGIEAALVRGVKLLYLESPGRLTGVAYSASEVEAIAQLLQQYDATAIWDQGLAPWMPEAYISLGAQPGMAERVLLLGEAWPGVGLESWFVGYIAAPTSRFEPVRSQKQVIAICTSTASQYAAVQAAEIYPTQHDTQREELNRRREMVLAQASAAGVTALPGQVAHLLAVRVSDAQRASLASDGIEAADGAAFGAQSVLRLTVTSDKLLSAWG